MPEVSVVVPARDVVDYVDDLLGDLRAQRFADMEVLLVDDRSTDGTRDVLERHVETDDRFHLLEGAGDGPSDARNRALDQAAGELLAFVDADDRISPDYLATMHAAMQDSGSEVVVANARRLHGGRTRASRLHLRACARPGRGLTLDERPELVYDVTVWNKLIRRELWESDGLRFAPGRWINDNHPSLRTHALARRIDVLDEVVYYWRERAAGDSITASKFHDAAARRKSLADRAHAIASTRTMLAEAEVGDGVRARFDERLLLHDLWTYLPMYHEGDRHYRRELTGLVEDVLDGLFTTLEDHPLGPLLHAVYTGVRDGDHHALPRLLAPDTKVEAVARDRVVHHRLIPGSRPARSLLDSLGLRRSEPVEAMESLADHLTLEARIEGVRLHAGRPPRLAVAGRLRIRDGASDLEGRWTATAWLTANGASTRSRRATADLGGLPSSDAHPLRRSGWRSFKVSLPLDELAATPELDRWTVQVGAELDGVHHRGQRTVAGYVEPTLAVGTAVTDHLDLFARLDRNGQVQLRIVDASVRVAAVHLDGAATSVLVHLAAGSAADRLWWQDPDGTVLGSATVDREGRARLPLVAREAREALQLWAQGPRGALRPRPVDGFATTVVSDGQRRERVLRPTLAGSLVLEERTPRLTLTRAWLDDRALHLIGPPPARSLAHVDRIALESVWSDAVLEVPLIRAAGRWHASLPLAALAAGSGSFDTAWTWRVLADDVDGTPTPLRTATEARGGLPLHAVAPSAEVELRLGARGTPRVLVGAPPTSRSAAGTSGAG